MPTEPTCAETLAALETPWEGVQDGTLLRVDRSGLPSLRVVRRTRVG